MGNGGTVAVAALRAPKLGRHRGVSAPHSPAGVSTGKRATVPLAYATRTCERPTEWPGTNAQLTTAGSGLAPPSASAESTRMLLGRASG